MSSKTAYEPQPLLTFHGPFSSRNCLMATVTSASFKFLTCSCQSFCELHGSSYGEKTAISSNWRVLAGWSDLEGAFNGWLASLLSCWVLWIELRPPYPTECSRWARWNYWSENVRPDRLRCLRRLLSFTATSTVSEACNRESCYERSSLSYFSKLSHVYDLDKRFETCDAYFPSAFLYSIFERRSSDWTNPHIYSLLLISQ